MDSLGYYFYFYFCTCSSDIILFTISVVEEKEEVVEYWLLVLKIVID